MAYACLIICAIFSFWAFVCIITFIISSLICLFCGFCAFFCLISISIGVLIFLCLFFTGIVILFLAYNILACLSISLCPFLLYYFFNLFKAVISVPDSAGFTQTNTEEKCAICLETKDFPVATSCSHEYCGKN
jgi:hypothetical protein